MGLKFEQCEAPESTGLWASTVREFVDTGFDAAEVDLEGRDGMSSRRALESSARNMGVIDRVRIVLRGDRVWLAKRQQPTPGTVRGRR